LPKIKAVEGTKPAMEPSAPFALLGHWLTDSGSALTFTDVEQITISGWAEHITPIIYYTDTYYITQKPAADEWNPKKFQKVNFHTTADGSIATCTSKMDADTEADAIAFDPVGVYSTDTDQCGQFTHSTMTPYTMPVAGTWAVGAGTLTVTDDQWQSVQSWGTTVKTIKTFGPDFMVSQMPADDEWNGNKWVKTEYFNMTANSFVFCDTMYNGDTFHEAFGHDSDATKTLDTLHPKGCGASGFSFSYATKK